jgi:hypothetical protein
MPAVFRVHNNWQIPDAYKFIIKLLPLVRSSFSALVEKLWGGFSMLPNMRIASIIWE